jgi:hypothetical protein
MASLFLLLFSNNHLRQLLQNLVEPKLAIFMLVYALKGIQLKNILKGAVLYVCSS